MADWKGGRCEHCREILCSDVVHGRCIVAPDPCFACLSLKV